MFELFKSWWELQPIRLHPEKIDKMLNIFDVLHPERIEKIVNADASLYKTMTVFNYVVDILQIRRIPHLYVIGRIPIKKIAFKDEWKEQPKGYHKNKLFHPIVVVSYIPTKETEEMVSTVAHELYHEYQHEHKINLENEETKEINAIAFALAFCDCYYDGNPSYKFPKISHPAIREEILSDVGEDGVPKRIREIAKDFKKEYNISSYLQDKCNRVED